MKLEGGKTIMTDPRGPNERLIVQNPDSPFCLYEMTIQYLLYLGPHKGSLQPTCSPSHPLVPHPENAINYSIALDDMRALIDKVGLDGSEYAQHSGKRGGACYAAKVGMIEEEIREIGNWKSTATARLYIDKSTPLRMKRQRKMIKDLI